MKKVLFILLMIITANAGFSQEKNPITRSSITYQIKNLGINTQGSIGGLQADVQFNPADLAAASITASIDVSTINTENSSRDEHLKSADFFDVAHYPKITLKSVSLRHKSGSNYSGQFNLTIKNQTKLVEIPFTYTDKGASLAVKGSFKINRIDFGVGSESMILSNDVMVNFDAEAAK
jgi:polyisoprenoid-binding protein YceI